MLKVRGIANFLGIIKVDKLVAQIPADADVNIDLSETRLVDMSYMDYLVEFLNKQRESREGVHFGVGCPYFLIDLQ